MTKPTVHLNGTSKGELLRQFEHATTTLQAAIAWAANATPNARDYYPQGPDAFPKAYQEHTDRLRKLEEVHAEFQELWIAVFDQ